LVANSNIATCIRPSLNNFMGVAYVRVPLRLTKIAKSIGTTTTTSTTTK